MGKHKPIYDPSTDCGDYVVVAGCHDLRTTGKKRFQKLYYTHTTRPGSLKSMTMDQMFAKWGGGEVLRRAVKGMLPKNRLQEPRLARLKSEFFPRRESEGNVSDIYVFYQLSKVLPTPTKRISSNSATNRCSAIPRYKKPSRRPRPPHRCFL